MKESKISLLTAILINVNIMVGAGIYINPELMAQKAGSFSYLGWLMSSAIFLPVIIAVIEISKLFPGEGSFYNYAKGGLGATAGFLSGWVYFLGYVSVQALQFTAAKTILTHELGFYWIHNNSTLFNAMFFAFITMMSLLSLQTAGRIQSALTGLKVLPLILVAIAMFIFPSTQSVATVNSSIWNVHYTLPLALFGYWGFESATSVSHRIEGGTKNASKSIIIAFIATVLVYTLFHLGIQNIMGADNLSTLGVAAFGKFLPLGIPSAANFIASAIPIIITIAIINSIYAEMTSFSFVASAMAKENLLFMSNHIKKISSNGQPYMAILMQASLCFTLVSAISSKNVLLALANLGLLSAFILTLSSLFILQRRRRNYIGLVNTVMGFISCLILGYFSVIEIGRIEYALSFVFVVLVGFIMFKIQDKK